MGLFDKISKAFEKKNCDICGEEIKLLGNRKLENGNLCKSCAAKLSPWFSERRSSTVEEIRGQLDYREANREKVASFSPTRTLGEYYTVYLDEDKKQFLVSRSKNFRDENPDVLDFTQVTGCDLDIDESKSEVYRKDAEGKNVSYEPRRYDYDYDFYVRLRVNHPWFEEMRFKINAANVDIPYGSLMGSARPAPRPGMPMRAAVGFDPNKNADYQKYVAMGQEIKDTLLQVRQEAREEIAAAAAPKTAVTCPFCGASTIPDINGCCEYCGGAVNG